MRTLFLAVAMLAVSLAAAGAEATYDLRAFGAVPDGKTLCTRAIQKAIDACAAAGGGTVCIPAGQWLTGTIYLKSRVTLSLDAGCTLLGSTDLKDYPENVSSVRSYTDNYVKQSLIAGEDLDRVAIVGRGTIDGQGAAFRRREYLTRPYVIRLVNCRDVLVEGVRMQASPMWMQQYLACDRVTIRGITVFNHVSYNNDGLDIDGCRDVTVSQCTIDSDDDALCLKSTLDRPCEDVRISDCVLSSHCNAFKMGTESNGGFVNIALANCTITSPRDSKVMYGAQRGLAGVALEIVDGGRLDGVTISNVAMKGVTVPLFMRLGNRARPFTKDGAKPGVGTFRNVLVRGVVASDVGKVGCAIAGLPGHPIEDVTLSDLTLTFEGGGTRDLAAREIAENADKYPESKMFGDLPAYGFYARHVKGLKLSNVHLRTAKADLRHAVVFDDAENVAIDGLDAMFSPDAAAMVRLTQTRSALVRGSRPDAPGGVFLRLEGAATRGIALVANDLRGAGKPFESAPDVPSDALLLGSGGAVNP